MYGLRYTAFLGKRRCSLLAQALLCEADGLQCLAVLVKELYEVEAVRCGFDIVRLAICVLVVANFLTEQVENGDFLHERIVVDGELAGSRVGERNYFTKICKLIGRGEAAALVVHPYVEHGGCQNHVRVFSGRKMDFHLAATSIKSGQYVEQKAVKRFSWVKDEWLVYAY